MKTFFHIDPCDLVINFIKISVTSYRRKIYRKTCAVSTTHAGLSFKIQQLGKAIPHLFHIEAYTYDYIV